MSIETHEINNVRIAEIIGDDIVVKSTEDGLDLLGSIYYQGFDCLILHEKNITPEFFKLKTGIAGEILQKFTQYRMRLAIIGDFSKFASKSLNDLIYESNKGRHVNFLGSTFESIKKLSS